MATRTRKTIKSKKRKGKVPPQLKAYLFKKGQTKSATTNKKKSSKAPKKKSAGKVTVTVNGKTVHKS